MILSEHEGGTALHSRIKAKKTTHHLPKLGQPNSEIKSAPSRGVRLTQVTQLEGGLLNSMNWHRSNGMPKSTCP